MQEGKNCVTRDARVLCKEGFYLKKISNNADGAKVTSLLKFRVLISCLTLRVSCLSPLSRQNLPAPLKIEHTLSHR